MTYLSDLSQQIFLLKADLRNRKTQKIQDFINSPSAEREPFTPEEFEEWINDLERKERKTLWFNCIKVGLTVLLAGFMLFVFLSVFLG